jgi:hypothetical protein
VAWDSIAFGGCRRLFAARLLRRAAEFGAEPYQRVSKIVKQSRPWRRWGLLPRHQDIVDARQAMFGQQAARRLAEATLGAVSEDGAANFL